LTLVEADGIHPDQTMPAQSQMTRKLRQRIQTEERGFTLVELLVVVLILGILAAIALPAFLGQREKSQDAEAKSAVRTAAAAADSYYSHSNGYAGMDAAALRKVEPSLNDGTAAGTGLTVQSADAASYKLTVTSKANGGSNSFSVVRNQSTGAYSRTCVSPGRGGCPSGGTW
jgi:type IV pilus assembly protein PilA